jgi:hypothetical protein
MFLFCFSNQAFYMTHTFDPEVILSKVVNIVHLGGFFTLLVALAYGAPPRPTGW